MYYICIDNGIGYTWVYLSTHSNGEIKVSPRFLTNFMQIFHVRIYEDVPFSEYLTFPGLSFSGIKGDGPVNPTEGMRLGTYVHQYLLEPEKYDGTHYRLVNRIAAEVVKHIGGLLKTGKRELTVTCTMVHKGFYIHYKGRVDLFAGNMVIDLKVSNLKILQAINHFGYNNQLNGYAIPLQATASVLFAINPVTLETSMAPVPNSLAWWEKKILQHGKPV